jgi:hypothetical protein
MKFKLGDMVSYKNMNKKTKFDEEYVGAYPIVRIISPVVYELGIKGRRHTVHAKQIKPYYEPIGPRENSEEENEEQWESDEDPEAQDSHSDEEADENANYTIYPPTRRWTDNRNIPIIPPRQDAMPPNAERIIAFRAPSNPDTISKQQARRFQPRVLLQRLVGYNRPAPSQPEAYIRNKRDIRKPARFRDD